MKIDKYIDADKINEININTVETLCDYYACIECPYENCPSKQECIDCFEEDKRIPASRADLFVSQVEISKKLDTIIDLLQLIKNK